MNSTAKSNGENSPRLKPSPSSREQGEMAALSFLHDMRTDERNHRRMEAAGDAMLRDRFGADLKESEADEMIQWHSPTTYNYPSRPSKSGMSTAGKLALSAALLAGGAGLGLAAPMILDALRPEASPVVAPITPTPTTDTDTQYGLGLYHGDEL